MSTVIEVHGLTRRFGDLTAVDHVEFEVNEGEVFGFLGPNGAGKTTTVRMLTGLLKPTAGNATIYGRDVARSPVEVKQHIGVVSETASPYLDMNAWDNLMFAAAMYELPRRQRREQPENLLRLLGLYDRRKEKVANFSQGLRKRVAIAIALVHDPPLLFLDEPTVGLDVQSARMIRDFLHKLNAEGTTIFLTTHYIEEADLLCNRIGIIREGQLIALDSPEGLKSSANHMESLEVSFSTQDPEIERSLRRLPAVSEIQKKGDKLRLRTENTSALLGEIARFAQANDLQIVSVSTVRPTLEDAFVRLTGLSSLDMESQVLPIFWTGNGPE